MFISETICSATGYFFTIFREDFMSDIYQKSGYLNGPFRLFYLEDLPAREYTYHYHDFHKLLIFLNGTVSYRVEGREYDLKPGDQVLIPAGEIHCPVVHNSAPYTRLIAYISPEFFSSLSEECDLSGCFSHALNCHDNLIRIPDYFSGTLYPVLEELIKTFTSDDFGTAFYQKIKFSEYLLLLNRYVLRQQEQSSIVLPTANPQVLQILDYINAHLTEDLSIDRIADAAFLNLSYLMHLFRDETGYTIGKYITEKRLYLANHAIRQGVSVTEACYQSGFRNYTTFYQAYKNKYHTSPKQARKK